MLLTDPSGSAWVAAAEEAAEKFGVVVRAVTIGEGGDCADADGTWARLREIGDGGAVLVRPDNHVAYRAPGPVSDTRDTLTRTLSALLGR